jgi:hypothetical protein
MLCSDLYILLQTALPYFFYELFQNEKNEDEKLA